MQGYYQVKLYIFILLPIRYKEYERYYKCEHLGGSHRPPYSVKPPENRHYDNSRHLEDKGSEEGYCSRYTSVVECRKERRGKYREATEYECQREYSECVLCHRKKLCIVSDEHLCECSGKCKRKNGHYASGNSHDDVALFEHVFELIGVACAVMVADNRCSAHRVANKHRNKYELNVHEHTVCGNTICSCIFKKLEIVHYADDGCQKLHHLPHPRFLRTVQPLPKFWDLHQSSAGTPLETWIQMC